MAAAGIDVIEEGGAVRGAIGPPELIAVRAVVGLEVEQPVEGRQLVRIRVVRARIYVLDQARAALRAVRPPEFRL